MWFFVAYAKCSNSMSWFSNSCSYESGWIWKTKKLWMKMPLNVPPPPKKSPKLVMLFFGILCCVKSKKSTHLIYTVAEAWNLQSCLPGVQYVAKILIRNLPLHCGRCLSMALILTLTWPHPLTSWCSEPVCN